MVNNKGTRAPTSTKNRMQGVAVLSSGDGDHGHFMAYDPNLSFWDQPRLIRGMFGILLISTCMTVFEMIFFGAVVVPVTKDQLDALNMSRISSIIASEGGDPPPAPPGSTQSAVNSFMGATEASERRLVDKNNRFAFASMGVFTFVLFMVLFLLYNRLRSIGLEKKHVVEIFGTQMRVTVATSIFTVSVLILFQIFFFFFGLKFKYLGGPEEILHDFNNALREEAGLRPVE